MDISKKLQIPQGKSIFVKDAPKGLELGVDISKNSDNTAVLIFATNSTALASNCKSAVDAAKEDRLSWIAYPKAGQLETDLSREKLVLFTRPYGIEPVRQISLDDVWSAMRFRPSRSKK